MGEKRMKNTEKGQKKVGKTGIHVMESRKERL